ncbi:MAG: hypothetical protein ACXABD_00070 [Candidatus Thorarchaeota archaeon]|jgi:hypothetical protein
MDAEEISIIPMDDVDGPSITLDIDGVDTIGDDGPSAPKSVNFGPGVELLMNDKKKVESSTPTADISLGDLDALEKELGEGEAQKPSLREARSNIFAFQNPKKGGDVSEPDAGAEEIKINMSQPSTPSIAKTLGGGGKSDQTWDGYGKFKDVPLGPEAKTEPKLTPEETLREKFKYLRKLEELESKGASLTKKYSMDSSLSEMQGEYEMIITEKEKSNSVKFQGKMLMACITGLEFLNHRFDPFDLKLDGWAEQVNENIDDYDEIFGELHQKYSSKAKMAPELKLLFQLGGGAIMLHMTNTMFKSAMPGMDDIMRQNPELMQQFQTAAVNSMGGSNPGFGNFMGGMMNPEPPVGSQGPPPAPIRTKDANFMPPPRPGNQRDSMRPDIKVARSDAGIDLSDNFANPTAPERSMRAEMKGPSDISHLLSGLKKTTIEKGGAPEKNTKSVANDNNSSTISISELKEMQAGGSVPKKSKRRPKSEKNTLSLDI